MNVTLRPNNLDAFWMPYTANRAYKATPRLLARAGNPTRSAAFWMIRQTLGSPSDPRHDAHGRSGIVLRDPKRCLVEILYRPAQPDDPHPWRPAPHLSKTAATSASDAKSPASASASPASISAR